MSDLADFLRSLPQANAGRQSFREFFYAVASDGRGEAVEQTPLHSYLCDLFESCWRHGRNLSLVAMPGIGKTTIAAHMAPWILGLDASETVACVSADLSDSTDQVSYIRQLIQSQAYTNTFPATRPDIERSTVKRAWKKDRFFLQLPSGQTGQTPQVQAVAATPTKERIRVSFGLFDDLMTRASAYSTARRTTLEAAFFETWLGGRLKHSRGGFGKHGWALCLQNCWLLDDLGHKLAGRPDFASVWVGVSPDLDAARVLVRGLDPEIDPLRDPDHYHAINAGQTVRRNIAWQDWRLPLPAGMTVEKLREERDAAPSSFARSHFLVAPDATDLQFPNWRNCSRDDATTAELLGVESVSGLPVISSEARQRLTFAAGVDVSGRGRAGNAIAVWALTPERVKIRCECKRFGGGFDAIRKEFADLERRGYRFSLILFESNAVQGELREAIRALEFANAKAEGQEPADWPRRLASFTTGANKSSPAVGLPRLAAEMETAGQTGAIQHPGAQAKQQGAAGEGMRSLETALDECPQIMRSGETPDDIMADWFAWTALQRAVPRWAGPAALEVVAVRPESAFIY